MSTKLMHIEGCTGKGIASIFRRFCLLLAITGVVPYALATESSEIQSPESISQAVSNYLTSLNSSAGVSPHISVTRLDPRLRLARCDQPLEAFTPPGQKTLGSTTVGIRCTGLSMWTLYVQATVALYQPVLIARRPLPRGTVLSATDVEAIEKDISRLTLGYLTEQQEISGMVLRRSINAGAVLSPGLLQPPIAVRRGEQVTILGEIGGVEVRMDGAALMDGAKGELIRVRNLSSGREIEGVVVAPGIVQVRL